MFSFTIKKLLRNSWKIPKQGMKSDVVSSNRLDNLFTLVTRGLNFFIGFFALLIMSMNNPF